MAYDPRLSAEFDRDQERLHTLAQGDSWSAWAIAALLAAAAALRDGDADRAVTLARHSLGEGLLLERNAGGWATAQLTDAEAVIRLMLAMAAFIGQSMFLVTGYWLLAEALVERPSFDDVARDVEALQLDPGLLATLSGAMLLEVRGRLRRQRGDRDGAVADLRACGATATVVAPSPCFSTWRSELALALPPGADDEAQALIAEELRLTRAAGRDGTAGLVRQEGSALRAAGLRGGDRRVLHHRNSAGLGRPGDPGRASPAS